MSVDFAIKICGLSTSDTMEAALDAGATMVGLVFHRKSPRSVSLQQATDLAKIARARAMIVALTVNPSDEGIDAIMENLTPDIFQLHGSESPERCLEIAKRTGKKIMKAMGVAEVTDLAALTPFRTTTNRILLDAKPPKDAAYPGGHGKTFDWNILEGLDASMPFMLSGGLEPGNVKDAIRTIRSMGLSLNGVDVSSGVESAPGVKDVEKIRAFIKNTKSQA